MQSYFSKRIRGGAIILALVTTALITTVASAMLVAQWQMAQVEAAERARAQAAWLLDGALQWSRLILRQDAQADARSNRNMDHAGEPWALTLRPTRLDAFLASAQASSGQTATPLQAGEASLAAVLLSGQILDAGARLNLLNFLYLSGADAERARAQVRALFAALQLPPAQADALLQRLSTIAHPSDRQRALLPTHLADLRALGVSAQSLEALAPYVRLWPAAVAVNLNTAPAPVLQALSMARNPPSFQPLIDQRRQNPWRSVDAALASVGGAASGIHASDVNVRSDHFVASGAVQVPGQSAAWQVQVALERLGEQVHPRAQVQGAAPAFMP